MKALLEGLKALGPVRIAALAAVAVGMMAMLALMTLHGTNDQMALLYGDLDTRDASQMVDLLQRHHVPYRIAPNGSQILVPADQVPETRLMLAQQGLPAGGSVGYEIFDRGESFAPTDFQQRINETRALEGELARTIRGIDRIQAARVHLVLPERPLFSRETPEPSASIVVRVRGTLEAQQIRAIRHLVASSVSGLKPQRVSIVDESGTLLADGAATDVDQAVGDERRAGFEKRMRKQVEDIVSSVVGQGRARVQLSADFDYNKITQTSDKFDPEGRVLRSSQTREEQTSNGADAGQVTVNNELPGNQTNTNPNATRDQSKKTEETNNYEISRTTKTEVTEAGRVNRISVAVLVDGAYSKSEKGELVYTERTKEELDRIAALVRSAIGFDQKRGDQVEVVNLRFADAPQTTPINEPAGFLGMMQFTKDDVMYVIELGVMMLLGLVVVFMVVRPLVRKILSSEEIAALAAAVTAPMPEPAQPQVAASNTALLPGGSSTAHLIDVAQVQGQVHAQSVHRVGELAERNPNETVAIVRQWLSELPDPA
jgi:flagellar M-ring protein FliF